MDINRTRHIKTLDYIISQTHVEPFRAALIAARNRLDQDERQERAGARTPDDWPYCGICGKAYIAAPTADMYTRAVVPACSCHSDTVWHGRPAGSDSWEYLIDPAQIPAAEECWGRFTEVQNG